MESLFSYEWMIALMVIFGYGGIVFEHVSKIHKTAVALLLAVSCWSVYFLYSDTPFSSSLRILEEHLAQTSQIVFFLIGAMTIVETIDAHHGFNSIARYIHSCSRVHMLWVISLSTFFLSAILDNLTTTIAMVSILRKLIDSKEDRWLLGSMVVIAANTGGAWTPIGDITTTMLWINGNLSAVAVIRELFIPCIISLSASILCYQWLFIKEDKELTTQDLKFDDQENSLLMFILGASLLIFVPAFKSITHLPPYMGMLISLAILWIFTDILYFKDEKKHSNLGVQAIIHRIDLPSALFFAGILLSVAAMDSAGILDWLAHFVNRHLVNETIIATSIGLLSSIVDNVPIVATSMGMYDLGDYPKDSSFWQLIAYCSGTGGSILIIGSAAGIALMGLEKVDFFWYFRKISFPAIVGYFSGIAAYLLQNMIFG